ncbi:hypothetical protein M3Y95_01009200 [Aphelenchoides besseyi]|nr:hypothetical protein M3Y95_01009200 [Aphelenchoides besseyi]
MARHLFSNKLLETGSLTRNFLVLFLIHFSNHFVQSCSPPDFARYQDTTYVSAKCADLILYPVNAVDQSDQYRFDYSDLASSSSGNAHSQGATVVITCSTTSNTQTVVEGFDQQRESINSSGGLVATCTNVGGSQYTWTVQGRILQFVDCR